VPESDQLRPVQIFTGARQRNAATERCYRTLLRNAATERCLRIHWDSLLVLRGRRFQEYAQMATFSARR